MLFQHRTPQVFDLNKDKTIEQREFVIVAALNDKLTGKNTESLDAPLELDLEMLAQHITAYKVWNCTELFCLCL